MAVVQVPQNFPPSRVLLVTLDITLDLVGYFAKRSGGRIVRPDLVFFEDWGWGVRESHSERWVLELMLEFGFCRRGTLRSMLTFSLKALMSMSKYLSWRSRTRNRESYGGSRGGRTFSTLIKSKGQFRRLGETWWDRFTHLWGVGANCCI